MDDEGFDLVSLLCSRLCHDLVSPVGAVNNGLEVLSDESVNLMIFQKRRRHLARLGQIDNCVRSACRAISQAGKFQFVGRAFGALRGQAHRRLTHFSIAFIW